MCGAGDRCSSQPSRQAHGACFHTQVSKHKPAAHQMKKLTQRYFCTKVTQMGHFAKNGSIMDFFTASFGFPDISFQLSLPGIPYQCLIVYTSLVPVTFCSLERTTGNKCNSLYPLNIASLQISIFCFVKTVLQVYNCVDLLTINMRL